MKKEIWVQVNHKVITYRCAWIEETPPRKETSRFWQTTWAYYKLFQIVKSSLWKVNTTFPTLFVYG